MRFASDPEGLLIVRHVYCYFVVSKQ